LKVSATAPAEPWWRRYREPNRTRAGKPEQASRGLGFEPWRAALRNAGMVEYSPGVQAYWLIRGSVNELYRSALNG
jgi:hypothetical protein